MKVSLPEGRASAIRNGFNVNVATTGSDVQEFCWPVGCRSLCDVFQLLCS